MNIPEISTAKLYEDIYKTIDNTNYLTIIRPYRGVQKLVIEDNIKILTKLLSNISHRINLGEVNLFEVHYYLVKIIDLLFKTYLNDKLQGIEYMNKKKSIIFNINDYTEIPYYDYTTNMFISQKKPMYNIGDKVISCLYEGDIINIKFNWPNFIYDIKYENGKIKLNILEDKIIKEKDSNIKVLTDRPFIKYLPINILNKYIKEIGKDKLKIEPFFHNYQDFDDNKFELIFKVTYNK